MSIEDMAEARAKTQDAESRARQATDPQSTLEWETEAAAWRAKPRRLEIEADAHQQEPL